MHTKHKQEWRRTSLVAPADDLDLLKQIAESQHRTLSQELRHLIAAHIDEHKELVIKGRETETPA